MSGEGDQQGAEEPGQPSRAGGLPALHRETPPAGRGGPNLPQTVWEVFLSGPGQHPAAQGAVEQAGSLVEDGGEGGRH